jgi:adenine-specific DNA methylase
METKDKCMMEKPKKLIEVAMPIKEISAESVRDKSIRHGHISTLHLWWARRPLPVCRAVVFASLVPDPLDVNCPKAFKDAVEILLGSDKKPLNEDGIAADPYKPYKDIPYTAAIDKMDDNARNRLLMFIGKYSDVFCENQKIGKSTPTNKSISDFSLIKWDNKNNDLIINKARKLIWIAHNASENIDALKLIADFDNYFRAIKDAEIDLYNTQNRHISSESVLSKEKNLKMAIDSFLSKMPKVFDPFAGGGAIPLEAARLGCMTFGNDINPVAHVIQKGSLEFPQKFGKPINYSKTEFELKYGKKEWSKLKNEDLIYKNGEPVGVNIINRLSYDVEFYSRKILEQAEKKIGHLYPKSNDGKTSVAYHWAKVGVCSNPSCNLKIPLLRQFYLCNKPDKKVYLYPIVKKSSIDFEIRQGEYNESWLNRGNLKCPSCGSITDVKSLKKQFINGLTEERLLAVIVEGQNCKEYRLPSSKENELMMDLPNAVVPPSESLPLEYKQAMPICGWGYSKWGDMFSSRQLFALQTLLNELQIIKEEIGANDEYEKGILTYLAILIDRLAIKQNSFIFWDVSRETVTNLFGRQAISMVFDYVESNLFCDSSGSASNQIDWIIRYIESESKFPFAVTLNNASSGDKSQFPDKYLTAVVTDPPYYDAIAYADLSDFFYVWLKRSLNDVYPLNFATPQTPKSEECTALKHHHSDDKDKAEQHFENKLTQIFGAIEHQTSDIVSIMFAHQSTQAWSTLCNSILSAKMNITGSWALDSEYTNTGLKADKAFLSSSVTVSAVPFAKKSNGDFRKIKSEVEKTVSKEVNELYRLGFRGADLLTACFGQAVSEFGKYENVEKADGSEVTVAELLEMARESAFNALLKGFDGDDFTKFYIGWLQLYSFAESEFDDAAKFSRVGLSINVAELFTEHILIKNGNKQTLGTFEERIKVNKNLGDRANNFLIDLVHRAMALYKGNNRTALLQYIGKVAAQPESNFWRVVTSLCEVLPAGCEDHKQALGLLTNKDSLIRESKTIQTTTTTQTNLFES